MENNKNINKIETPAAEELLKKIQELEEGHAHLKDEMSKLMISDEHEKSDRQRSNSISLAGARRRTVGGVFEVGRSAAAEIFDGGGVAGPSAMKQTETQYMNILQSVGQSVHMFDLNGHIIYWNRMAQNLYGYTVAEALGKTAPDVIIGPNYSALATLIIQRAAKGEGWSGEFPVRNKRWEGFTVITNVSPSCDESGIINGVICVSTDARPFRKKRLWSSVSAPWRISLAKLGLDPQQPLQMAIASDFKFGFQG